MPEKEELRIFEWQQSIAENKIIACIHPGYFDPDFDSSRHELQTLFAAGEEFKLENVIVLKKNLSEQAIAISKKLSRLIVAKNSSYSMELNRIKELEELLTVYLNLSNQTKAYLRWIQDNVVDSIFMVILNHTRKIRLRRLLKCLLLIKALQQTESRLKEIIKEKDFVSAFELCNEYNCAAKDFSEYNCIRELGSKLQDTLVRTNEAMCAALSDICFHFSSVSYCKTVEAYNMLQRMPFLPDHLTSFYLNAIKNECGYSSFEGDLHTSKPNTSAVSMALQLCCTKIWNVLNSYNMLLSWHGQNISHGCLDESDNLIFLRKFQSFKNRLWTEALNVLQSFFMTKVDVPCLQFEDFIEFIPIINRFKAMGKQFCNGNSHVLDSAFNSVGVCFLRWFKRSCLDEMKTYVENEEWAFCPVNNGFTVFDTREFKLLHVSSAFAHNDNKTFDCFASTEKSPFLLESDYAECESNTYDILLAIVSSVCDTKGQVDVSDTSLCSPADNNALGSDETVIVANTTLNILRYIGKYILAASFLPCDSEFYEFLTEIFDLYLYTVYRRFIHTTGYPIKACSVELQNHITSVENTLVFGKKVPKFSPSSVDLQVKANVYGFTARNVAVESIVFLAEQYSMLYPYLEKFTAKEKLPKVYKYFGEVIGNIHFLRDAIFYDISRRIIDRESLKTSIYNVAWNINEIKSQHSSYVDFLLQELKEFDINIMELSKQVPIKPIVIEILWYQVVFSVNQSLVEGYSSVKKCSNEGRALMQLDFQQFMTKLNLIHHFKQVPLKDFVDAYIKAYYLPEISLEEWIFSHNEYSVNQLCELISVMPHVSRRVKHRLVNELCLRRLV